VTVWALLGAFDWDSLLTVSRNSYERGVFGITREGIERTPFTDIVEHVIRTKELPERLKEKRGWWRRPDRALYPAPDATVPAAVDSHVSADSVRDQRSAMTG
jgi:dTDP-4-dehydrorhamnose reductase